MVPRKYDFIIAHYSYFAKATYLQKILTHKNVALERVGNCRISLKVFFMGKTLS